MENLDNEIEMCSNTNCLGMLQQLRAWIANRTIAYHASQNSIDYNRLTRIYSVVDNVANPFPPKHKWLNAGFDLASRVFGPDSSVITPFWKLEPLYNDMWSVGDISVPHGHGIIPIRGNVRNVLMDARRTLNLVQIFKNLLNGDRYTT